MKLKDMKYLLLALLFLGACTEKMEPEQVPEPSTSSVVQGEVIVQFSDEMLNIIEKDLDAGHIVTKSSGLNAIGSGMGIISMKRIFPDAGEYEARSREAGMHRWYKVKYDTNIPVTRAMTDLSELEGIISVEPVRPIKSTAVFNDPKFSKQWHYYNDGKLTSSHVKGIDINVIPVWENYTTGSDKVIVSVVDGGVDQNHEDLKDNLIGGRNFISGTDRITADEHGTHVAGTIAAVNNNNIGVCGIAGGNKAKGEKGVKILSCQIFSGEQSAEGAEAIKWGADHGAVISQNSWGYVFDTQADAAAESIDGPLKAAIDYFIKNAGCDGSGRQKPDSPMKGGIVIFAAGNDNYNTDPIGKYEPVLSVGSVAPDGTKAYYSNHGKWVDICAPGGSAEYADGEIMSTLPRNKYGTMQGTSMACPHVSGVAALIVSYCGGPGFTPALLREKLIKGGRTIKASNTIGPLVDAFGAITYGAKVPPDAVADDYTVDVKSNNLMFECKIPRDSDDKKAFGIIALASQDKAALETINLAKIPANVSHASTLVGDKSVSTAISVPLTGLDFDKDYYVTLVAFDYNKNYSPISAIKTVHTTPNGKPVITVNPQGDIKVKAHENVVIKLNVTDPDGHSVTLKNVDQLPASLTVTELPNNVWQLKINGRNDLEGSYQVQFVATDEYGLEAHYTLNYEILENHPPKIVKPMQNIVLTSIGERIKIDMTEYLDDPDGEILTFVITDIDRNVLHINPKDNVLNLTSLGFGASDVTIVALDARKAECRLTFKVLVVENPDTLFNIYPNPVVDKVQIAMMAEEPIDVTLSTSTGVVVYHDVQECGIFNPIEIDMTGYAPGVYNLKIVADGKTYNKTIVKK